MATPVTRRRLIASLAACAAGFGLPLRSFAELSLFRRRDKKGPAMQPMVYVGCDKGIYLARFDSATGHLGMPVLAASTVSPSYFAFGPVKNGQRVLYAANETNDMSSGVSSFAVDPATGMLRKMGRVGSGAPGPCYLSVDSTGKSAYLADYAGSAVASYRTLADGTLSEPVSVLKYKDSAKFGEPGPQKSRQDASHPHSATISPDNRFMVVCDLGTDRISIYALTPETAVLASPTFFHTHPGSGPRHVAFHPNGRWIYGIDELSNKIDQYLWTSTHAQTDGTGSQAMLIDTDHSVSTLAPGYSGPVNTAAEVAISENGFFLYASNRGEETLVVFAIDQNSGMLTFVQRIGCGGKGPRQFTLDPSGRWLLCGNQKSGGVAVFARDAGTGKLSGPVHVMAVDAPMFTLFG